MIIYNRNSSTLNFSSHITIVSLGVMAAVVAFSSWLVVFSPHVAAACPPPATDLGSASLNVSVPTAGTYRAWSRIMAPDTTNNSYSLEIDGSGCYVVGDSQVAANTWTWIDYQNGTAASKVNLNLTAGTHTLKLVGREANVKVDRVILAADPNCVPIDTGNNCTVNVDQIPPTVAVTAPAADATVSGKVDISATATDESGIANVEIYVDSVLKATTTNAPYTYSWDTTTTTNGVHSLMAKATDKVGNVSSSSRSVTVKNGDGIAPSAPTNLTATASGPTVVNLKWNASTDNTGVTGYFVQRNNVTLAQIGNVTTYKDSSAVADTAYTYRVIAFDGAGNLSQPSSAATVTTPKPPVADTQAPSVPSGLSAVAVSTSQINLKWSASADNVGVAKYNIYRSTGGQMVKVATVTTTSYGDSGLSAGIAYAYYVTAEDAAGNVSDVSATATATTNQPKVRKKGNITGRVTSTDGDRLGGAHVTIWVNGDRRLYHTRSNGNYNIPRLSAGTYKVKYSSHDNDFVPQTFNMVVGEGKTVVKNVSLKSK